MASEDFVTVEVLNWKKYNPRTDVKNPSWFRVEHSLLEDDDFYDFSHSELIAWIYMLSQANKKRGGIIRLSFERAEKLARLKRAVLLSAISKLKALHVITVHDTDTLRARAEGGTDASLTGRDGTGQNETGPPPPPASHPVTQSALDLCKAAWIGTLREFDQERNLIQAEELLIFEAIKLHGGEAVELALFGAAFEPSFDGWNPAEQVDIARVLLPERKPGVPPKPRIQKFVGWGAKERARRLQAEAAAREKEAAAAALNGTQAVDPEAAAEALRIREQIRHLGRFQSWTPQQEAS